MKVADLLKIGGEMLKLLSKYDVKMDDYRFAELYFEYERRSKNHEKYIVIVAELAELYGISQSTVERVIGRLRRTVER